MVSILAFQASRRAASVPASKKAGGGKKASRRAASVPASNEDGGPTRRVRKMVDYTQGLESDVESIDPSSDESQGIKFSADQLESDDEPLEIDV